jgi:hypothetical protein
MPAERGGTLCYIESVIRRLFDRLFGIDARSLAAFRVAIGAIILADLLIRSGSIIDHYSDAGFLPRSVWIEGNTKTWGWSLHAMNGLPAFEGALFAVAGIAASALIVGWRTQIACAASWVLLASLQQRDEFVLNGGDVLLRVLLFWAMFLPLGRRWSVDALRRRRATEAQARSEDNGTSRVVSVAAACIVIQFLLVYIFTGLYKLDEPWRSGDAMRRSFSFDMFVKPPGAWMLGHESLLRAATFAVPWVEVILPALCLLPWLTRWWRGAAIIVFSALHLGIELTMTTGLFPWACLAGWLLLVPGAWWDGAGRRNSGGAAGSSGATGGASEHDEAASGARGGSESATRTPLGYLSDGVLLFLLGYVLLWNIAGLREDMAHAPPLPVAHQWLGQLTTLNQKWNMFASPPVETGWYRVTGRNSYGDEIDLLTGVPLKGTALEKPSDIWSQYIDHRWRKLMFEVMPETRRSHWPRLAQTLAKRWNRGREQSQRITTIEMVLMRETTPKAGETAAPARRVVMYKGPVAE